MLDIGCGVGAFLRLVADRGAQPFGLDASEALIELARERLPDADLRAGEMEALPYDDDTFDLVTGFNRSSSPTTSWPRCATPDALPSPARRS